MTVWVTIAAAVITVAAAARSTWSPCGLSMLATITPLSELGRGHRYRTTASWFVVGSSVGGVTLGAGSAALAAGFHALSLTTAETAAVALGASAVAVASDVGLGGFHLPVHQRQVNERWLDRFRPWVYGAGFGWQIGTGLATYIMTAAVYLTILLSALTGEPWLAVGFGALFGLVRGLSVCLGRRITSTGTLRDFHLWFSATGPKVRWVVVAAELAVTALFAFLLSPWIAFGLAVASVAGVAVRARKRRGSGTGHRGGRRAWVSAEVR